MDNYSMIFLSFNNFIRITYYKLTVNSKSTNCTYKLIVERPYNRSSSNFAWSLEQNVRNSNPHYVSLALLGDIFIHIGCMYRRLILIKICHRAMFCLKDFLWWLLYEKFEDKTIEVPYVKTLEQYVLTKVVSR